MIKMTLIFSIIAICISAMALYLTHFRGSRIRARVGPKFHVYHPTDGGTAMYLQVVFFNESPTSGVVQEILLRIINKDHPGECYYCSWQEEGELPFRGTGYKQTGVAAPFVVPGKEGLIKTLWFLYSNNSDTLEFSASKYNIKLYCTLAGMKNPSVVASAALHLSSCASEKLQNRKANGDSTSQIFTFEGREAISELSSDTDVFTWKQNK